MFEAVGHHVEKIKRVRYGPLTLDVPPGKFRSLTLREIEKLKSASTTVAKSAATRVATDAKKSVKIK
jgi:23S rRNA pseudouridine2605 synthase